MSTRSSPLSSPSSSPLPQTATLEPSTIPHGSAGASRAASTSSSLSNDGLPPSSLPDAAAGEGEGDDADEVGSEATTATIPLRPGDRFLRDGFGSDSDLTEEEDEDEYNDGQEGEESAGPPVGISGRGGPVTGLGRSPANRFTDASGSSMGNEAQSTPQASTSNKPAPAPSPIAPRLSPTSRNTAPGQSSSARQRSPSLTPPPPPGNATLVENGTAQSTPKASATSHAARPNQQRGSPSQPIPPSSHFRDFPSPSSSTSSQGIKRKRDGQQAKSASTEAGSEVHPIGHVNGDGTGAPQAEPIMNSVTPSGRQSISMAMDDLPLPENTDDPDAQMAFLDALDAFDAEDQGQLGGEDEAEMEVDAISEGGDGEGDADDANEVEPPAMVAEDGLDEPDLEVNGDDAMEGLEPSAPTEDVIEPAVADVGDEIPESIEDTHNPDHLAPPDDKESDLTPSPAPTPSLATAPTVPTATHTHSSHAPPPSQAAMRALLTLELKFAALRDRLYIERMEEAAEEEEMVLNGTHPALQQLYKTLSHRRERLHELASRRHAQAMEELKVVRKGEQDAVWSWWTDERDRMHWGEFEQTWSKRRRLAREKNEIESVRWARPVPVVGDPRCGKGFDWAAGPSPARLSSDEGNHDLALMEHRHVQLSRHASPATFPPLPGFPMGHPQQSHQAQHAQHQQQQQQTNPYASYAGPTYAEAAGTSSGYADAPRTVSGGAPRSRLSTPGVGGPSNIPRPAQQSQTYAGPGLMDHLAYPRNATALGPTSSSSSISFFQPLSQTQSQQQRREGRTVPTASTMFGPNSSQSATNSPVAQSFPFNQAPAQSLPSNPNAQLNGTQNTNASSSQASAKEIKQENIEYGPWGNRVHVPMGFGLGFGMGGGGSGGSTAGFGTLGSTATPPASQDQPPSYTAVFAAGAAAGAGASEAEKQKVATPTMSRTPTPNGVNGAGAAAVTNSSAFWNRPAVPIGNGETTAEVVGKAESGSANGETASGGKNGPNGDATQSTTNGAPTPGMESSRDDGDVEAERIRQEEAIKRRTEELRAKSIEREKERERERERPKYPGLAEYLGSGSSGGFGAGLGRMAVRVGAGGPLSPPGVGVSRSPFPAQPPAAIPNPQTASRS